MVATKKVKDIMVPLSRYGVVNESATLLDALLEFDKSMEKRDRRRQPPRAILVVNDDGRVVGKIGQMAFLRALEPKHNILADMSKLSSAGVSEQFIASVTEHYKFFQEDLHSMCARARHIRLKDIMHPLTEHIDESATLSEAIYRFVVWDTLSILVTKGDDAVGLLRLSDLCQELAEYMKNIKDD
jgi:CBS domain-containing protein